MQNKHLWELTADDFQILIAKYQTIRKDFNNVYMEMPVELCNELCVYMPCIRDNLDFSIRLLKSMKSNIEHRNKLE